MNEDLTLVRVDPSRRMARFYRVVVQETLLGTATVRVFGRIGKNGRELIEHHSTRGDAEVAGARFLARKLRRGYRPRSCASI